MSSEQERLNRILRLARRAQKSTPATTPEQPIEAPFGFATKVAARWVASPRGLSVADLWERISWWGSGLAAASCLIAFAIHQATPEPSGLDMLLDVPQMEQPF